MRKLELCLRKEEIDEDELLGKVAVVFDIFLATSTAAAMLHNGAKEVIPVLNYEDALQKAKEQAAQDHVLVGEYLGRTIEGFLFPFPTRLKERVNGKTVVFSTTNGTVALRKTRSAKAVFAASMLNEGPLTNYLIDTYRDESIVLVCSGSNGKFSLEDFFGAGSFIKTLTDAGLKEGLEWRMSDASLAALHFYQANVENAEELLQQSRVGKSLVEEGFRDELVFTLQKNACPVIPHLDGDTLKPV